MPTRPTEASFPINLLTPGHSQTFPGPVYHSGAELFKKKSEVSDIN